jgi:4-oxalocrotonate tautomerase
MPVITMEVGKLSKEQKKDLIKGFTEVASEITGIDKKFIIAVIREWPDENLGINGQTVAKIKSKPAK